MNSDQTQQDNVSLAVIAQLFLKSTIGVLEQYKWLCSMQCDNNNTKSSGSELHVNTPDQHTGTKCPLMQQKISFDSVRGAAKWDDITDMQFEIQ